MIKRKTRCFSINYYYIFIENTKIMSFSILS